MRLYHGSEFVIEKPRYGGGKKNNDYGRGFYCTEDIALASEWAVDEQRDGYVNIYDVETDGLAVLDLNSAEYCILHWITVLLMNRRFDLDTPLAKEAYRYLTENFAPNLEGADIVTGYRADDSYFSYAQDFVNGVISVSQLGEAMRLGKLGEQIMLRSKRAFAAITYQGCEGVSAAEWYERKLSRETAARQSYRRANKDSYVRGELYMVRIIDEEVKPDDPRLR